MPHTVLLPWQPNGIILVSMDCQLDTETPLLINTLF